MFFFGNFLLGGDLFGGRGLILCLGGVDCLWVFWGYVDYWVWVEGKDRGGKGMLDGMFCCRNGISLGY